MTSCRVLVWLGHTFGPRATWSRVPVFLLPLGSGWGWDYSVDHTWVNWPFSVLCRPLFYVIFNGPCCEPLFVCFEYIYTHIYIYSLVSSTSFDIQWFHVLEIPLCLRLCLLIWTFPLTFWTYPLTSSRHPINSHCTFFQKKKKRIFPSHGSQNTFDKSWPTF